MTLVMAYCVLLSAAVAASAALVDQVFRARQLASRWLWMMALLSLVPLTVAVMVTPLAAPTVELTALLREVPVTALGAGAAAPVQSVRSWLALTDTALTITWISASLLLIGAIIIGRWRVTREKARARRGQVQGHDVLLTNDLGPAVAGVRQPVVFVPEWVIALDDRSQELLLAHEVEHARRRDTAMLMAGAALTALLPWNPVAWWLARRLRVAVELDCDARVLRAHPDIRRYADLLLVAAGKPRFTSRFLAAHFGEHASDLERRIDAMTHRNWKLRSLLLAAIAAVGLTVASCEAPRPDPVAPLVSAKEAEAAVVQEGVRAGSTELASQVKRCTANGGKGCQISVIVRSAEGKELARYAGEVPVAELPEASIQSVEVEKSACGTMSCSLIWITLKPGELLSKRAAKPGEVVERERVVSDELELRRKRTNLEKDLAFTVEKPRQSGFVVRADSAGGTRVMLNKVEERRVRPGVFSRDESAPPRIVLRDESAPRVMPNIVIYSSAGAKVREIAGDLTRTRNSSALESIKPDDIAAIEVLKANACPVGQSASCPQIKITLKPGREGAYIKR